MGRFYRQGFAGSASEERGLPPLRQADGYRAHLERRTRDPHPTGSAANYALAGYLATVMDEAGLWEERHEYDAWMPYHLPSSRGAPVTPIRLPLNDQEYVVEQDPFSAHPDLTPGWNVSRASQSNWR